MRKLYGVLFVALLVVVTTTASGQLFDPERLNNALEGVQNQLEQLNQASDDAVESYDDALQQYDVESLMQGFESQLESMTSPAALAERQAGADDSRGTGMVLGVTGVATGRPARLMVGATGMGPRDIPRGLQVYNARFSENDELYLAGTWKYEAAVGNEYLMLSESEYFRSQLDDRFVHPEQDDTAGSLASRYDLQNAWVIDALPAAADGIYAVMFAIVDDASISGAVLEGTEYRTVLAHLSAAGEIRWFERIFDGIHPYSRVIRGEDGNLYVFASQGRREIDLETGDGSLRQRSTASGGGDLYLASFTPDGTLRWEHEQEDVQARDIVPAPGGGVLLAGGYSGTPALLSGVEANVAHEKAFVAHFRASGELAFASDFGPTVANNAARSIAVDDAGNIYAAGTTSEYVPRDELLVARLSPSGRVRWVREFGDNLLMAWKQGVDIAWANGAIYVLELYLGGDEGGVYLVELDEAGGLTDRRQTSAVMSVFPERGKPALFVESSDGELYMMLAGASELSALGTTLRTVHDPAIQYALYPVR